MGRNDGFWGVKLLMDVFIYDIKLSRYQPLTHEQPFPKRFLEACCIFNFVCPFFIFTSNSACQKTSFIFRITKQAESYHPFGERLLQIYGSIPTHLFQVPRHFILILFVPM